MGRATWPRVTFLVLLLATVSWLKSSYQKVSASLTPISHLEHLSYFHSFEHPCLS